MAAPTIRDIEALETAIRDYLSLVLEGQAEIKASLDEIKAMLAERTDDAPAPLPPGVYQPTAASKTGAP